MYSRQYLDLFGFLDVDVSAIAQSLDSLKWLSAHVPDTFHVFEDIFKEVQLCLLCQEIHGKNNS